jgi:hypothetical protein
VAVADFWCGGHLGRGEAELGDQEVLTDALGSTGALANLASEIVEGYDYTPYGDRGRGRITRDREGDGVSHDTDEGS